MVKYTLTEALKIIREINKQHLILVAVFTGDDMSTMEEIDHIVTNGDAIQIGVEAPRLIFDLELGNELYE